MREVEVMIIGAGSAGLFALSQVRKQTDDYVLINGGELGTTCARVGCMPSKVMIQVAEDFHRQRFFEREGIDGAEALSIDAEAVMEHVQDLRDVFVDQTLMTTDEMDDTHLIEGVARFVANDTVEVDGQPIRARKIIIATGSSPVVPDDWREFGDRLLTTDSLFELETLPRSVAVIGLGVIGLEIGQALQRLGVEVTGIEQCERLAGLRDDKVNQMAQTVIGKTFPLWLGEAAQLQADEDGVRVIAGERQVVVEKVLVCMGRKPNLSALNLSATDLPLDAQGVPVFDVETMQVGELPVFIAGDVANYRPLLHEAGHQGRIAGYNAVHAPVQRFREKTPLAITFCDPNIAVVGMDAADFDEATMAVGEVSFAPVGRALIIGNNRGLLRLYVRREDGLLLGASMCCVKGEHLAHLLAWSIQQGLTVFDLLKMPFYHPVVEEALQAALYHVLPQLTPQETPVELQRRQESASVR